MHALPAHTDKKTRLNRATSVGYLSFRGSKIVIFGKLFDKIPCQRFKLPQSVINNHATHSFDHHRYNIRRIA